MNTREWRERSNGKESSCGASVYGYMWMNHDWIEQKEKDEHKERVCCVERRVSEQGKWHWWNKRKRKRRTVRKEWGEKGILTNFLFQKISGLRIQCSLYFRSFSLIITPLSVTESFCLIHSLLSPLTWHYSRTYEMCCWKDDLSLCVSIPFQTTFPWLRFS